MIHLKDTADDGMWVAKRMYEQPHEEIYHKRERVWTLTEETDRFFLHNKTKYLIQRVFI